MPNRYNLERLAGYIRAEHPEYSETELDFEARRLRRELQRLRRAWSRSQVRFRRQELYGDDLWHDDELAS